MADAFGFAKLVPGFDFLEGLLKSAGAAMPGMGQWVAPTLDAEELDKRIQELRTVQYWLEQNARMLGATIQALEVQRMTLSTLKTMNVQMGDLRDALLIAVPTPPELAAAAPSQPEAAPDAGAAASPGGIDPLQWWGALTKQFTELATTALSEGAAGPAKTAADAPTSAKRRRKAAVRPAAKPRKRAAASA